MQVKNPKSIHIKTFLHAQYDKWFCIIYDKFSKIIIKSDLALMQEEQVMHWLAMFVFKKKIK